jgi:hypothetical protein
MSYLPRSPRSVRGGSRLILLSPATALLWMAGSGLSSRAAWCSPFCGTSRPSARTERLRETTSPRERAHVRYLCADEPVRAAGRKTVRDLLVFQGLGLLLKCRPRDSLSGSRPRRDGRSLPLPARNTFFNPGLSGFFQAINFCAFFGAVCIVLVFDVILSEFRISDDTGFPEFIFDGPRFGARLLRRVLGGLSPSRGALSIAAASCVFPR